jgi:predicted RNA-binding protein with PIN domain
MPRTFVIDGYNALFQLMPALPADRDVARQRLVREVRAVLLGGRPGRPGDRVHVVFDASHGSARRGTSGKDGPISWSYAEGSADDAIVEWLRRHESAPADVVVVTDDRELRGRAKQLGSKAVRVHDFFAGKTSSPESPPSPASGPRGPRPPPLKASDFGLPEDAIDLDAADPDDL